MFAGSVSTRPVTYDAFSTGICGMTCIMPIDYSSSVALRLDGLGKGFVETAIESCAEVPWCQSSRLHGPSRRLPGERERDDPAGEPDRRAPCRVMEVQRSVVEATHNLACDARGLLAPTRSDSDARATALQRDFR